METMKYKSILIACSFFITFAAFSPAMREAQMMDDAFIAQAQAPQGEAMAALVQGRQLLKRGNAEQALAHLEKARKLFTEASNQKGVGEANAALGDLYSRQGQYDVALKYYQDARAAFGSTDESYNSNLMLARIGDMYYSQARINEARSAYSQMSVKKPEAPNPVRTVDSGKSKINKLKGFKDRLKGVATSTPSTSTTTQVASVGTDIASEAQRARNFYRQFIIYSIYELGMGRVDYFNGQLDSAQKHFQNALDAAGGGIPLIGSLGQTRRFRVAARTSLGDIALNQGRYDAAIKFYTDAADGARKDERPDLVWPARRGIGKALLAQAAQEKDAKRAAKQREDGINAYREALKTIESIRQGSLNADEARSTFLATTKDVYDEASSALAERALIASSSSNAPLSGQALTDAAEAFKIVEQSRARSLLDMLAEGGGNITEGVPADLLKRKQENLDRQQEIAQELTGVTVSADAPAKTNEALESELKQLSTDYDSIENQIRTASPRYAALTMPQPLSLSEAQQQVLDEKTALLEYSLGEKQSYLWAATRDGVALYKLPARRSIEQQVIELRKEMIPEKLRRPIVGINVAADAGPQRGLGVGNTPSALANVSAFAAASNALYKAAVEPAASMLGDKRLLIVPDGALNYIPFEALSSASSGADYSALPFLIKTHEVVYAPSASVVALIRQQGDRAAAGRGVLLVADPVFNSADARSRGASAQTEEAAAARGLGLASAIKDVADAPAADATKGLQLARLSGTRAEADQVAQLVRASRNQADEWLDLKASEENVKTLDLKKYRIIHIATHGLLDAERPQFSGLILSLVGNKSGDGFLRTEEIFNLNLGARLVMLSACETGLGKEKRGEGVIGLTRAFMYAGAPTVGVSLWSVADQSTAMLMTDFYKRMFAAQGAAPTTAMRAAQLNMITSKRYSAPFY
ncbi:MAG: CHAT domain-containing protein, partial [Pyrinomonadaceae bacterium]